MELKQRIGQRITEKRKEAGITIKLLSERAKTLAAARISNWEQGTRAPGPEEAMLLSKLLNVSASYLLCLTDDPRGELMAQDDRLPRYIPLIDIDQMPTDKNELQGLIKSAANNADTPSISIDGELKASTSKMLFAVTLNDNSMEPEFKAGDIVIFDGEQQPTPGQYVIAADSANKKIMFRKYRETSGSFELIALNVDWPIAEGHSDILVIGSGTQHQREI